MIGKCLFFFPSPQPRQLISQNLARDEGEAMRLRVTVNVKRSIFSSRNRVAGYKKKKKSHSSPLISLAMRAGRHAAGASEPWVCGTGASLFQLTVKAPLALLVCQPERQWSESATSSSWACATDRHLDPQTA